MEIALYYYQMTKENMLHSKYFLLLKYTLSLGPDLA